MITVPKTHNPSKFVGPKLQAASRLAPQAVVVHAGARDSYQLAQGLHEQGLLRALVTNVYAPSWIKAHYGDVLAGARVKTPLGAQAAFAAMRLLPGLDLNPFSDRILSRAAKRLAENTDCALFCYSYYAFHAFTELPQLRHKLLFQLHPHPKSVRRILEEEIERVPAARDSLLAEPDMRRSGEVFDALAAEPHLASGIAVASRFTASTLTENGIAPSFVKVLPYGVETSKFPLRNTPPSESGPLTVMWLGQLTQRKGISYFLDAIRAVSRRQLRVLVRGRGNIDNHLMSQYRDLDLDIQFDLPRDKIVEDLHRAHVYVLPSLAEGFGQTILEAMSCGVPVIVTPNTCGPDLIESGTEGFIVPIRDSEALAQRLQWCLGNRADLSAMGVAAGKTATQYGWDGFRRRIRQFYFDHTSPQAT